MMSMGESGLKSMRGGIRRFDAGLAGALAGAGDKGRV